MLRPNATLELVNEQILAFFFAKHQNIKYDIAHNGA